MLTTLILGALSVAAAAGPQPHRTYSNIAMVGISATAVSVSTALIGGFSDNTDLVLAGIATMPLGLATSVIGRVGIARTQARYGLTEPTLRRGTGVMLAAGGAAVALLSATWLEYSLEGGFEPQAAIPMVYTAAGVGMLALSVRPLAEHRRAIPRISVVPAGTGLAVVGRFLPVF
jgi:hypothetical protein